MVLTQHVRPRRRRRTELPLDSLAGFRSGSGVLRLSAGGFHSSTARFARHIATHSVSLLHLVSGAVWGSRGRLRCVVHNLCRGVTGAGGPGGPALRLPAVQSEVGATGCAGAWFTLDFLGEHCRLPGTLPISDAARERA